MQIVLDSFTAEAAINSQMSCRLLVLEALLYMPVIFGSRKQTLGSLTSDGKMRPLTWLTVNRHVFAVSAVFNWSSYFDKLWGLLQ